MLKIRRSRDRLIFNMGIPIPEKDSLYIETVSRFSIIRAAVFLQLVTNLRTKAIFFYFVALMIYPFYLNGV